MEETTEHAPQTKRSIRHAGTLLFLLTAHVTETSIDNAREYLRIMVREKELFLGSAFFLLGLLSFESARYCDGNSADYLSCTRPATYYYFDALDSTLIVMGVFFMLIYWLKRRA